MRPAAETPGRFQASFVNGIESSLINAQRDRLLLISSRPRDRPSSSSLPGIAEAVLQSRPLDARVTRRNRGYSRVREGRRMHLYTRAAAPENISGLAQRLKGAA